MGRAWGVVSELGAGPLFFPCICSICRKGGKGTWIRKQLENELKW